MTFQGICFRLFIRKFCLQLRTPEILTLSGGYHVSISLMSFVISTISLCFCSMNHRTALVSVRMQSVLTGNKPMAVRTSLMQGDIALMSVRTSPMQGDIIPMSVRTSPIQGDIAPMSLRTMPIQGDIALMLVGISPMQGDIALMSPGIPPIQGDIATMSVRTFQVQGDIEPIPINILRFRVCKLKLSFEKRRSAIIFGQLCVKSII